MGIRRWWTQKWDAVGLFAMRIEKVLVQAHLYEEKEEVNCPHVLAAVFVDGTADARRRVAETFDTAKWGRDDVINLLITVQGVTQANRTTVKKNLVNAWRAMEKRKKPVDDTEDYALRSGMPSAH